MPNNIPQSDFDAPDVHVLSSMLQGYEVHSLIAVGGMGAVYKARQISLDRIVAIKVLPRELGDDEEFREGFQVEAKMMAKLNHPNLISIFDFGHKDGLLYIIMEYVEGKTLYHSAHGKTILQTTAVSIIQDILKGLEHAHEVGMLHRDIKPANILLGSDAVPKVGDFGLARPTSRAETGVIYGSPGYVAPEVMDDPEIVDERADIFAVGVIFYELLTGHLPDKKAFVPASSEISSAPEFDHIIERAIHPNMDMRYPSAEAMHEAIEGVVLPSEEDVEEPVNPLMRGKSTAATRPKLATGSVAVASRAPANGLATPASPRVPGSPAPQHTTLAVDPTGGSPVMRNLVIIIILVGAIFVVKDMIDKKKERIALEEAANEEKNAAILAERKRIAAEEVAEIEAKVNVHQNQKKEVKKENGMDPLAYLETIQSRLVAGDIPEVMPDGTFSDGVSHFMYVPLPMTWYEADAWCLSYGGQLAVTPKKKQFDQLRINLPESAEKVWLGLGTNAKASWVWLNGSSMADSSSDGPNVFETKTLEYAAFNFAGDTSPNDPREQFPFYIQWSKKGSPPISVIKRLQNTGVNLTKGKASYPIGSVSYKDRVYSIIGYPASWDEAADLADLAGGRLFVPSNQREYKFVSRLMRKLPNSMDVWVGGQNIESEWVWYNGEEWVGDYSDNELSKSGGSLAMNVSTKGDLVNYASSRKLGGFIIEWDASGTEAITGKFSALKKKARVLVSKINQQQSESYAANLKKLNWAIGSYKKGSSNEEKETVKEEIESIQTELSGMKVLSESFSDRVENPGLKELCFSAYEEQQKITSESQAELETVYSFYMKNINELAEELTAADDIVQATLVKRSIERAKGSVDLFLKTLGL